MKRSFSIITISVAALCAGCATAPPPTPLSAPPPLRETAPEPMPVPPEVPPEPGEVVKVRVVVSPKAITEVPKNSQIVITDMAGPCAMEVRDALMRRLVDNADFDVLTRDNLHQIMAESKQGWLGDFDTRTSVRLGELLSASSFIVGRVIYCGSPAKGQSGALPEERFDILAVLQILDLRTGKVVVSSAAEGTYRQQSVPLLVAADAQNLPAHELFGNPAIPLELGKAQEEANRPIETAGGIDNAPTARESEEEVHYPTLRAAEDLANSFADKFFSRPTWEDVEMWTSPSFGYGHAIRYVKLGHCRKAVGLLESEGARELRFMPDGDVARYLHNYGVSLLCDNQPEAAISKLRSAYRIDYDPTTLRMMELVAKITEWSLTVDVDQQPEVEMLAGRDLLRKP